MANILNKGECAICATQKVKTISALEKTIGHLNRTIPCPSADPEMSYLNEELIRLPGPSIAKVYEEMVEETKAKKRPDSVMAINVCLKSQVNLEGEELEKWKKKSVKWLKDYFGEDKVVAAVYHGDEHDGDDDGPHIHAVVIPVFDDEKGGKILAASRFLDGREKLSNMITSYSECVEEFGLKRGERDLQVTRDEIRQLKIDTKKEISKSLPRPAKGQSAEEYYQIAQDYYRTANTQAFIEKNTVQTELQKEVGRAKIEEKNARNQVELLKNTLQKTEEISAMKDTTIAELKEQNAELMKILESNGVSAKDLQNLKSLNQVFWSVQNGYSEWASKNGHPEDVIGVLDAAIEFYKIEHAAKGRNEKSR